jgi:hypothetical protein
LLNSILKLYFESLCFEEVKAWHLLDWQEPAEGNELVRFVDNKLLDLGRHFFDFFLGQLDLAEWWHLLLLSQD